MDKVQIINMVQEIAFATQNMPGTFQRVKSLSINIADNGDLHMNITSKTSVFLSEKAEREKYR